VVTDFRGGLNTNKLAVTGVPGTLRTLRNAHINRGGEIEKRKAFVPWRTVPANTYGLAGLGGRPYVFGTGTDPGVPSGVTYQQLAPPAGEGMRGILSAKPFLGKMHVIVEWTNARTDQFYDGTRVTDYVGFEDAQNARVALPFGEKMYVAAGQVLYSSKVAEVAYSPRSDAEADTDAGAYDMSTHASGTEEVTGLGEYQDALAIFSRRATQIWSFAADPDSAAKQQSLPRVGAVAPRSVVSFNGSDVFFLSDTGIRSLRARSGVSTAAATDVGTPIDGEVTDLLRSLTPFQARSAFAEIEPTGGRYWLTLGGTTFVFSYFPASQVGAWSTYALPAGATDIAVVDEKTYVRAGNVIYLYGGDDGATYDTAEAEIETAYLDGRGIATWKAWRGLDIAAEGTWQVYAAFDPAQPDAEDLIATLTGSTFYSLDISMYGFGPMVKLRFVSVGAAAARLGSIAVHYDSVGGR
jgi:hypothetical protein